jgi:hypothetical protein
MKPYLLGFLILTLIMACEQKPSNVEKVSTTLHLEKLETTEEKMAFLQEIFDADQGIRKEINKVRAEHDVDSKEDFAVGEKMHSIDAICLTKIKWYLDSYEYPDQEAYGKSLSMVPALVVHHSFEDGIRRKFYPQFKAAYDAGSLDPDFFALFLGRMYEIENGEYFRMESPYLIEDQISALIVELDL